MWNYSFTVPSILVLTVIVIYFFALPRLPIRLNHLFLTILVVDVLTILFDYTSSRIDETFRPQYLIFAYILNMGFFVMFLLRSYILFLFTLKILEDYSSFNAEITRRIGLAVLAVSELVALSSPLTHAVFYLDDAGYHRGNLYIILYISFFFYLILSSLLIAKYYKEMVPYIGRSLVAYTAVLLTGNLMRIMFPYFLIMNTFCLIAILILYLSFENPAMYLADYGNIFNGRGFRLLISEWNNSITYKVLAFSISNYNELRGLYGDNLLDEYLRKIAEFLARFRSDTYAFHLRSGCFAVIGEEDIDWRILVRQIRSRFCGSVEIEGIKLQMDISFLEAGEELYSFSGSRIYDMMLMSLEDINNDSDGTAVSVAAIDTFLEKRRCLEEALNNNAVELFLQPLIEGKTNTLIGAEALARIRDSHGQIMTPDTFIPLAEKDGSIDRIGEQMLRKTCAFVRDYNMEAMGMKWISVNVSPKQCMQEDLPERIDKILQEYKIPSEKIHLELTEESILDYSLLKKQVMALTGEGYCFSLDDYGSGYSNLSRVRHLPFENIKLDMEIVWDYFKNPDMMLPTIIQVFKQMNFSITAEGVETAEMAAKLTEIGCDYLQGYYYSKPIPVEEFLKKYGTGA